MSHRQVCDPDFQCKHNRNDDDEKKNAQPNAIVNPMDFFDFFRCHVMMVIKTFFRMQKNEYDVTCRRRNFYNSVKKQ